MPGWAYLAHGIHLHALFTSFLSLFALGCRSPLPGLTPAPIVGKGSTVNGWRLVLCLVLGAWAGCVARVGGRPLLHLGRVDLFTARWLRGSWGRGQTYWLLGQGMPLTASCGL